MFESLLYILQEFRIAGETRVHAYGFHISRQYKADLAGGFYSDWGPGRYGPYSAGLHADIGLAVGAGIAEAVPTAGPDRDYATYGATLRGRAEFRRMLREKAFLYEVCELVGSLQRTPLEGIMAGIRRDYPDYA